MKIKLNIVFVLLLFFSSTWHLFAQPEDNDSKLANHYFNKGEFEKAEPYFEKIYRKYGSQKYFEGYFMSLFYQDKLVECEKVAEKQIKRDPYVIDTYFKLANVYTATNRNEKALQTYDDLIKDLPSIPSRVDDLGNAFKSYGLYDYAISTYQKGRKVLRNDDAFHLEMAELYSMVDKPEEMIREYLDLVNYNAAYVRTVQNYLSRIIDFDSDVARVEMLRKEILTNVQRYPNKTVYNEMFIWYYTQIKEFNGAVIQAKALDAKTKDNGKNLFQIGQICQSNQAYDAALKAYKYLEEFGPENPYYHYAIERKLQISFEMVKDQKTFTKQEVQVVADEFEKSVAQINNAKKARGIVKQLAEIYAFYLDDTEKAKALINEAMKGSMSNYERAEYKILLGDIYVVSGDIWEASLLYMQVAKDFSEDLIGHEAKFKNAKVFYYDGEFDYAKAQLDVLKASTSKLIANNAMQLSLLLQDNLGLDTNQAPVKLYAKADLLLQQNKFNEALFILDSLESHFPFHSMIDEVLFKKGQIYEGQQNWLEAIKYYEMIAESYADDILADDAIFRIAEIYYNKLDEFEKAATYYKRILFDFESSLYSAAAREKYRSITAIFN